MSIRLILITSIYLMSPLMVFADGGHDGHDGHRGHDHERGSVELYHDDGRCDAANLVGVVGADTICATLSGSNAVWGVKLNGVCRDISDQEATLACEKYKGLGESGPGAVQIYHDDGRCDDSKLVASVGPGTNCATLEGLDQAWGVKIGGVCKDISDVAAPAACEQFKGLGGGGPGAVQLYHDDGRCDDSKLVATVGPRTNCGSLNGMEQIWGVKIGGVCKDISDTDAPSACEKYKGIGSTGPHAVELFHDDGRCEPANLVAGISGETNCSSLDGMQAVWGVRLNGVCRDVSDLDAPAACEKFKGLGESGPGAIQLYHDDGRCEEANLVASVSVHSDCSQLGGMNGVWGIKANGVCRDIPDLDAPAACLKYTGRQ